MNIDTGRPVCVAVADVQAARGRLVTFSYRINDPAPSCGAAAVKITIYHGRKIVKTIRVASVAENLKRTCSVPGTARQRQLHLGRDRERRRR